MIGDLTNLTTLRVTLRQFGVHPSKQLSQNFLVDSEVLETIVEAADLQVDASVLEVGAGTGVLTRELATHCARVLAVELDQHILPLLRATTQPFPNVSILHDDILRVPMQTVLEHLGHPEVYRIVANLPYHISAHFLQHVWSSSQPPHTMTLLLQREVAERICAAPGDLSLVALAVQVYGTPEVVATVPRSAFWPVPAVDSAILHVTRRAAPVWPAAMQAVCFRIAKLGFQHRRKTLVNSLAGGLRRTPSELQAHLTRCGIAPTARAQELTVEQWLLLTQELERQDIR